MPPISLPKSILIGDVLVILIIFLLVFISISVTYLTFVSWKDKRRLRKSQLPKLKK